MELNRRSRFLPLRKARDSYPLDNEKSSKISSDEALRLARRQKTLLRVVGASLFLMGALCLSLDQCAAWLSDTRLLLAVNSVRTYPRVVEFIEDKGPPPKIDHRVHFFFPEESSTKSKKERNAQVIPMITSERIVALEDSDDYNSNKADQFETAQCKAQYQWQKESKPTCNTLHETDLTALPKAGSQKPLLVELIDNGYWRDVWKISRTRFSAAVALKSLRYTHDVVDRNFDRNRRDAVAMERLTSSKWVLNVYGACGNSGFYEFAHGGTMSELIWPEDEEGERLPTPPLEKIPLDFLRLAIQATLGLAATHNSDKEGVPAIAHTDITPSQFVISNGQVKLNDFNRARFLRWHIKQNRTCYYHVGNNPGTNRSPEEYAYKRQSEKVDIYSLGNIFYMLVSRMWPFHRRTEGVAQAAVKNGIRPPIPFKIINSTNPVHQTLFEAIEKAWRQDPNERPTARELQKFLIAKAKEIAPEKLVEWHIGRKELDLVL